VSILTDILSCATTFDVEEWSLNMDIGSKPPLPVVGLNLTMKVPADVIPESTWDCLDNDFCDPETNTCYYAFDLDGDETYHWGHFSIQARGNDIPAVLDVLQGDISKMRDWLTTLSGKDNPIT